MIRKQQVVIQKRWFSRDYEVADFLKGGYSLDFI
jgi:hypothetical protein